MNVRASSLFGYRLFAIELGLGFLILSGGLTLACMVLPLLVRGSEEALRATPPSYRQAAALGLSQGGLLRRVLVPAAAPGIAAALILSVGRALAESAALLFTARVWKTSLRRVFRQAVSVPGRATTR